MFHLGRWYAKAKSSIYFLDSIKTGHQLKKLSAFSKYNATYKSGNLIGKVNSFSSSSPKQVRCWVFLIVNEPLHNINQFPALIPDRTGIDAYCYWIDYKLFIRKVSVSRHRLTWGDWGANIIGLLKHLRESRVSKFLFESTFHWLTTNAGTLGKRLCWKNNMQKNLYDWLSR